MARSDDFVRRIKESERESGKVTDMRVYHGRLWNWDDWDEIREWWNYKFSTVGIDQENTQFEGIHLLQHVAWMENHITSETSECRDRAILKSIRRYQQKEKR